MKDPQKLELSLNYWIADSEAVSHVSQSLYQKPSHKQVTSPNKTPFST